MLKTKTIKTPLLMAVAFGPTYSSSVLVFKSKLLHSPEAQSGFVPKHSRHGCKNIALRAQKPILAMRSPFFSVAQRNGVFASDDVLRCGAMCGGVVVGAGACSQAPSHDSGTEARRAKTSEEGFLKFFSFISAGPQKKEQ